MKTTNKDTAQEGNLTVEKVFKVFGGGTPSTSVPDFWEGSIPWITSADLGENLKVTPRKSITKQAIDASATNLVPAGSVIVATRVGLGKVGIAETAICFSQDCQGLVVDTKTCDSKFAALQLKQRVQIFRHISRGTTINGVTKKQLLDLPFQLPPLSIQRRIVAEIEKQFSRLDEAIAYLKRVKANLKRYKAAVLKAAVEGKLTEEWRKAHKDKIEPASVLLERIREERNKKANGRKEHRRGLINQTPTKMDNSDLPNLPEGWVWARVGQLYAIVGGGTPSTSVAEYWKGDIPWITSADIYGLKDIRPRKKITKEAIENSATSLVPGGSLIVVTRVGLGKIALTRKPLCFSQDSQALIGNTLLSPDYSLYYLSQAVQIFKYKHRGTTIAGVTKKQLSELPFALPSLAEQQKIMEEIERRLAVEEELEKEVMTNLQRAERLRQAILHEAFTGQFLASTLCSQTSQPYYYKAK